MALQTSGAISLDDMHVEAGGTSGTEVSLNDADIRDLILKGAGAQAQFSEWYGAAREYALALASDVSNIDVRALAIADGWDGNEPLAINVNSGTTVYSTTTSTAGMLIAGSFPNGVTINNSGAITGRGGSAGQDGGDAVEITTTDSVTITNNSGAFIAGGGGGGAASQGGGGAGQSLPGVSTASVGGPYSTTQTISGTLAVFGCSEGGQVVVTGSCSVSVSGNRGYGADQGAFAGSGSTSVGCCSTSGTGTGGGPPPCTASASGTLCGSGTANPGGTGGSVLSATSNVTNSGGGWGAAGTGTGAGAGGAAITGTYSTLTNNGTIYGST